MSKRDCPYYRRYYALPGHDPRGICSFGCYDEPSCITDEPYGGWPWKEYTVWIYFAGRLEHGEVVSRYEEIVEGLGPVRVQQREGGTVLRQHDEGVLTLVYDGAPRPWKLPHGRRRWRRR